LRFHRKHGKLVTITAVRPPSRFGGINISDEQVLTFDEKPQIGEGWINGKKMPGDLVFQYGCVDGLLSIRK
jgi:NDP-sugar pyrophosphorylase family protein